MSEEKNPNSLADAIKQIRLLIKSTQKNQHVYYEACLKNIEHALNYVYKGKSEHEVGGDSTPSLEKNYEEDIKKAFPVPFTPATPDGQIAKRIANAKQEGAEWFWYNIHTPLVTSLTATIEKQKEDFKRLSDILIASNGEKVKRTEEVIALREIVEAHSAKIEQLNSENNEAKELLKWYLNNYLDFDDTHDERHTLAIKNRTEALTVQQGGGQN